jgi:hypothetical protein
MMRSGSKNIGNGSVIGLLSKSWFTEVLSGLWQLLTIYFLNIFLGGNLD